MLDRRTFLIPGAAGAACMLTGTACPPREAAPAAAGARAGDPVAARNVGVPVRKVKIGLFMGTACAATLFACVQVLDQGSADVLRGVLKEFEAIIAAVIGGCLLTGGYGSAIGASFGALIFGTVQMGIFYTGVNTDWFKVFLGVMMLIAVLFNNYIRRKVTEAR
jgi:simple sugar transport system permease protein